MTDSDVDLLQYTDGACVAHRFISGQSNPTTTAEVLDLLHVPGPHLIELTEMVQAVETKRPYFPSTNLNFSLSLTA